MQCMCAARYILRPDSRIVSGASHHLGDDAVGGADTSALVAVGGRHEFLGEQQRLAVTTQHRLHVAHVRHVHRELVRSGRVHRGTTACGRVLVDHVTLQVDQRRGRAQTLTGRPQPPASNNSIDENRRSGVQTRFRPRSPARAIGPLCVCVCVGTLTFEINDLQPRYMVLPVHLEP